MLSLTLHDMCFLIISSVRLLIFERILTAFIKLNIERKNT